MVDAYNVVASKYFLSIGAHDLDKISGPISFRLSLGGEAFTAVGGKISTTCKGDYLYADDKQVLALLDSKDSDMVKLSSETTNLVLIIQGTPGMAVDYRRKALVESCERITGTVGGSFEIFVVE